MDTKLRRVGHIALSVYEHRLLLIWGGYMQNENRDGVEQSVEYHDPQEIILFDPVISGWSVKVSKGHIPPANSGACGVAVRDTLFIYGGYFGDPDLEGNSNNIYQLNLNTWIWTKLEPSGCKPLHCDKLFGWAHQNRIYFFGGFGTPPSDGDRNADHYEYVPDRSHQWYMGRGWNNQLVAYNLDCNKWEWPKTNGQTPSPRAALAGFKCQSCVCIFGGRLQETRMNDLYILDMNSMTWSENLNFGKSFPRGRSWHSFTYVGSFKSILYGGLSSDGEVLGDCWTYDLRQNSWTEISLKMLDRRLWHQSVCIGNECIVIGGVRTNILTNQQEAIVYADNHMTVSVAPHTLLRSCVESIARSFNLDSPLVSLLPIHLQNLIKARRMHTFIIKTN